MAEMPQFVVSDTHFDHDNILRHTARPYSCLEENNEALVDNWNSIVPNRALVAVLGDFAWRNHAKWIQRLHGKKILVCGSHDRMNADALALFREVHRGGAMLNFGNQRLFWCAHTCHRVWERGHWGVPHLFGHSHGRLETYNLSVDIGVDSGRVFKKCFPIPIEEVQAWMSLREEDMRKAGRIVEERGRSIYRQDDVWWLANQLRFRADVAKSPHWAVVPVAPAPDVDPDQDPGY